jgi:protein-S-isoprenylcysteine O-methyltransferase Ste14
MTESAASDASDETAAEVAEDEHDHSASRSLFDLRWLIAGLFTLYGVVLIVIGLFDSAEEVKKADGIRINVWTGLGMLILGLLFGLWSWWRPLQVAAPPPVSAQAEED